MAQNIFAQTIDHIHKAAGLIGMPDRLKNVLSHCKNEIIMNFPVRMDDGRYDMFAGFRAQHNNVLGPYKGGIRFHPTSVDLDHIKGLAAIMTIKCALMKLPFGGGKGGLIVDPQKLSLGELERLTRRFTSALASHIGPNYDIPAPDVGTNKQIMAWMADTYMNLQPKDNRFSGLGVVTGKPLQFGGSPGREKATGQGVAYVVEEMVGSLGLKMKNLTFSIIGLGNVGSWTARLLVGMGARLVAALGRDGAIHNEKGLDLDALLTHQQTKQGFQDFRGGESVSTEEFYTLPVDLFIPAALEQMVDKEKAKGMACKIVAEAANAPLTPEAERLLRERGIEILPAVLCNAGGVTVSYFEWKQNRQAETWTEDQVETQLKERMVEAARRVKQTAKDRSLDLQTASHCTALDHIQSVYQHRGIFP